jgi:hypothetical protein
MKPQKLAGYMLVSLYTQSGIDFECPIQTVP